MYSLRWDIAGGHSAGLRGGIFWRAEQWREGGGGYEKMLVPTLETLDKSNRGVL